MPGTNAGTGWPQFFDCAKCRRTCRTRDFRRDCPHTQKRTGKTRPYKGHNRGVRGLVTFYEYTCSCGHRGWSRHHGVMYIPLGDRTYAP